MIFRLLVKILAFAALVFAFACSQDRRDNSGEFEHVYLCDTETIVNKRFVDANSSSLLFENIWAQSKDFSFSGTHSIKLTPANQYGLTTKLKGVNADDYIAVTVWRKSGNNSGVIIIDDGEGFYNGGKKVIEKKEGWEKLFIEVFAPPTFVNRNVKIFVWNNGQDSVYFDDLQIIHSNKKSYPAYNNLQALLIHADKQDLARFNKKRVQAFKTTVLVNSDDDYANMVLFDGKNFLNGKFRLKGDLVDHIQGRKWSFRIKLKKGFAWNNICTFSIQNPSTRNFLYEWVAHKIFEQEDVLTTRYGFVPVKMNNESLGIYAWEEHFDKQLVENRKRREGPIVRFDESVFWQRVLETKLTKREWDIDYFEAAKIIPFKIGRTSSDSLLNLELVEAQKLLLQYKNCKKPVSQVFDIEKLAKYYALIDITQAYHGFTWHNQRFYYNPVTCLLEPIAFDGYIEGGIYKRIEAQITGLLNPEKIASFNKEELMLFQAFADKTFRQKYIGFLETYSKPAFINAIISEYQAQTDSLSEVMKQEFQAYNFNFNYIKWQAGYIQKYREKIRANVENIGLAVSAVQPEKFIREYTTDVNKNLIPFQLHAYYNSDSKQIDVLNFQNSKVTVLGAFMKSGLPESFTDKPVIDAFKGGEPHRISIAVNGEPQKLLFGIGTEMFETEIAQWAYSDAETLRQLAVSKPFPGNLPVDGNTIVFDGDYQFANDIIIPDTFNVVAKPGTKINLLAGATFVSFSPVKFIGTKERPIIVTSGDNSANGFNVLQPNGKSELKNVHFSGLSSLAKKGWQTPAAVVFYEANVDIQNCIFASNSNCDDALNIVRSEFTVTECQFENTFADAFDSDFCTGTVQNCTFKNIGNDAIDFSGSDVTISGCKMDNITDKAISGGENSALLVTNCEINKANIGVAAKDLSTLQLDKVIMNNTVYGLVAFVKKPEYGPATISVDNLKMKNNIYFHQIEKGSKLILNGKLIEGREKNLAKKLYQ